MLDGADNYWLAANKEKMLVAKGGAYAVVGADEGAKFDKPIRANEMLITVDPVSEWKQLFTDAWRLERDYFYDPNMHGVNWNLVKERYMKMINGAMTLTSTMFVP